MQKTSHISPATVYETESLRGFSRSLSELQVLLLSLVLLYFFIPTEEITNYDAMVFIMVIYALFVIAFRYFTFQSRVSRWKIALETWAMIGFITAVLWHTGLAQSPLLNLYLLVIIACAITLGRLMTLLEILLIACCYSYMVYIHYSTGAADAQSITVSIARFSPFLLVAYVTSMLATDILETKKQIALLSHTDDLTGLLNLHAFNLILDKEVARVTRYKQPFTVIMVDIDSLKAININHGDSAGSRLVRFIADSILDSVRTADVLAHLGSGRFSLLMSETSTDHAKMVAERIRAAIYNTSFDSDGYRVAATVSVGIASFPECVDIANNVVAKAEVALKNSKQEGRNMVTFYDQDLESPPLPA